MSPHPARNATILGPKSRRGFQQLCGLTGSDVDGSLGPISWRAAQRWAGLSGKDIDGICGPITSDAIARKTGARGLRSILENVLLDTMYDLPSLDGVQEVIGE